MCGLDTEADRADRTGADNATDAVHCFPLAMLFVHEVPLSLHALCLVAVWLLQASHEAASWKQAAALAEQETAKLRTHLQQSALQVPT